MSSPASQSRADEVASLRIKLAAYRAELKDVEVGPVKKTTEMKRGYLLLMIGRAARRLNDLTEKKSAPNSGGIWSQ